MSIKPILFLLSLILTFSSVQPLTYRAPECVTLGNCHSHDFQIERASPRDQRLILHFAVKYQNVDQLYALVNDLSDPQSQKYGKWWTFEQLGDLTSDPKKKSVVLSYLTKFVPESAIKSSPFTSFITVDTDIQTAERIINGKFYSFRSSQTAERITRTLEYQLPNHLDSLLDYVSPTIHFPALRSAIAHTRPQARPEIPTATPHLIRSYYNITTPSVTNMQASQSVFATLGQSFDPNDLANFQYLQDVPATPITQIKGTNKPKNCRRMSKCDEASLDVQYITATAPKAPTTFWSIPQDQSFSGWLEEIISTPNSPLVHSISYGGTESNVPVSELNRCNQDLARAGAQGITVLASTGDDGANPHATSGASACGIVSNFPTGMPYITAVGATMGPESNKPEVACQSGNTSIITSGGGFSRVFERPSYQYPFVDNYISNPANTPPTTQFNSKGRAYPDVSMLGNNYWTMVGGNVNIVSGTSASTPVFAGVVTLINNARLNLGKSSVGFINPALYSIYNNDPSIFNDMTSGDNKCTRTLSNGQPICCPTGFVSVPGWDAVTGLGSVNVERLIDAFVNL